MAPLDVKLYYWTDPLPISNTSNTTGDAIIHTTLVLDFTSIYTILTSFLCLLITLMVLATCREKHDRSTTLMNVTGAHLLNQLGYLMLNVINDIPDACFAGAMVTHFIYVVLFAWILIECIQIMHLAVNEKSLHGGVQFGIGWVLPAGIVGFTIAINMDKNYRTGVCWVSNDSTIVWTFISPLMIFGIAIMIVLLIMMKAYKNMSGVGKKMILARMRITIVGTWLMLPLVTASWMMGFYFYHTRTVVFEYIYTGLVGFQGIIVTMLYVAFNPDLWMEPSNDDFANYSGSRRSSKVHPISWNSRENYMGVTTRMEIDPSDKKVKRLVFVP